MEREGGAFCTVGCRSSAAAQVPYLESNLRCGRSKRPRGPLQSNLRWGQSMPRRAPVASCALCFRRLVRVDGTLAAAAAPPHSSDLRANFRGHRVRCVHVCLCVLTPFLLIYIGTECLQVQMADKTIILTSFSSLRGCYRNRWFAFPMSSNISSQPVFR